jgi:hypothetical protein
MKTGLKPCALNSLKIIIREAGDIFWGEFKPLQIKAGQAGVMSDYAAYGMKGSLFYLTRQLTS